MIKSKLSAAGRAFAIAQAAVLLTAGVAHAQEADATLSHLDEIAERVLQAKRAVVLYDIDIDNFRCERSAMVVARVDGAGTVTLKGLVYGLFGAHRRATAGQVEPGTYVVRSVSCTIGRHTNHENLLIAGFRVGPGEVVNIGRLKVDYKPDPGGNIFVGVNPGTVSKSVEPLDAASLHDLREKAPKTVAKAVVRNMTIVGGPTERVKKR